MNMKPEDDATGAPALKSGEPAKRSATDEQPAQATIKVEDAHASAGYANFCRVSSTPEELILDLGLNPHPYATGETTVHITQRIIMNHFTAKRLLNALGMALQDRKSTRLNSSHIQKSRMPSSA